MKQTALIISICLILTTILSNGFTIISYANDDAPSDRLADEVHFSYLEEALSSTRTLYPYTTNYNTFLAAYYDNLTYNLGVNYKQSCGYIAIAMLLSYYDTFLNDSIIPEQYDVASMGTETDMIERANSPGVMRDLVENVYDYDDILLRGMSAIDYFSIMNSISDRSLHAKLLTIGASHGYYNFNNNLAPALTSFEQRLTVLTDYLNTVALIEETDYEIFSINRYNEIESTNNATIKRNFSNEVKEFAKDQIMAGRPVLLAVHLTGGGHAVIAYDYMESTDSINCHMGYGANETNIPIEAGSGICYFQSALAIDFNMDHSHSYNYGVTTIENDIPTTEYYCYDNCSITTYLEKEHSYTSTYESVNSASHKAYCHCGDYVLQGHELVDGICTLCGCEHTHEYTLWKYLSSTKHIAVCECGSLGTRISSHAVSGTSTARFQKCVGCGAMVDTNSDFSQIESIERLVTANGSYILPNGIIVLVDEDITAYLNGELVFYNENENVTKS